MGVPAGTYHPEDPDVSERNPAVVDFNDSPFIVRKDCAFSFRAAGRTALKRRIKFSHKRGKLLLQGIFRKIQLEIQQVLSYHSSEVPSFRRGW